MSKIKKIISTSLLLLVAVSALGAFSVTLSPNGENRVVALRAISSPTNTIGTSLTVTKYGSAAQDTHGGYSASTGLYTVPIAGFYHVTVENDISATWSATAINNGAFSAILQNGTTVFSRIEYAPVSTTTDMSPIVSGTLFCNAGDTIGPYAKVGTGASSITLGAGIATFFTIEKVTGPSVVGGNDTVAARYNTTTTTVGTSPTVVVFTSRIYDTTNSYNTSTGVYTVQVAGKYRVSAYALSGTAPTPTAAGDSIYLRVRQNSVNTVNNEIDRFQYPVVTSNISPNPNGTLTLTCLAGDTIDVAIFRDAGVSSYSLSSGTISIEKIGN